LVRWNQEEIGKEIDEKKAELQPKVLEVYEAAPAEIKVFFFNCVPFLLKKKNRLLV
jgi:DREPP plasma membrane polypeptide